MPSILAIDTSSPQGSVGLKFTNGEAFFQSGDDKETYASRLFRWLQILESKTKNEFKNIKALAVTSGPGTFTGLRVGLACAKGIVLSTKAQLFAFPTLETMALAYALETGDCYIRPLLNAGRGELYSALFQSDENKISRLGEVEIVHPETLAQMAIDANEHIIGNGISQLSEETKTSLSETAIVDDRFLNLAGALLTLAEKKLNSKTDSISSRIEINYIRKATS